MFHQIQMEEIRTILRKNNFSFKKQYGQNFISDRSLLEKIVRLSGAGPDSFVLEIGTGAGTLTAALAETAKSVVSYEIDTKLKPVLSEALSDFPNVTVFFKDFLKEDLPRLEETLPSYLVVANLPYYITSPLIMKFIDGSKKAQSLTVMVQEDVAKRLCAKENTPEYGAITAMIARRASASFLLEVPRQVFFPVPNVDSALVRLAFEENRLPVRDPEMYRRTVRAVFLSRRKTLENNLIRAFSLSREQAKGVLSDADIPPMARGESLSPERLAKLSDLLAAFLPDQRK